jgi:hypothetical protein
MSVVQQFGKPGYAVALVSRTADRHAGYVQALDATEAESALRGVVPAVDFASVLLPEFTERGSGGLLFRVDSAVSFRCRRLAAWGAPPRRSATTRTPCRQP